MAETVKKEPKKKVKIMLPLLPGIRAEQTLFVSVNFQNYLIKRGVEVEVPEEVYEVIKNSQMAEAEANAYAEEQIERLKEMASMPQ